MLKPSQQAGYGYIRHPQRYCPSGLVHVHGSWVRRLLKAVGSEAAGAMWHTQHEVYHARAGSHAEGDAAVSTESSTLQHSQ